MNSFKTMSISRKNALPIAAIAMVFMVGSSTAYAMKDSEALETENQTSVKSAEIETTVDSDTTSSNDGILKPIEPIKPSAPVSTGTKNISNKRPTDPIETPAVSESSSDTKVEEEVSVDAGISQSSRMRVRINNSTETTIDNSSSDNGNSSFKIEIKESTSGS